MPIYVQWKWQENTSTFLLILHFDAVGPEKNLRNRDMGFLRVIKDTQGQLYIPAEFVETVRSRAEISSPAYPRDWRKRTVTTWAPSHVEIGLLSELLAYANIINGLKVWERQMLLPALNIVHDIYSNESEKIPPCMTPRWKFLKYCGEKAYLLGRDLNYKTHSEETVFCFELSQDYIDYLKEVLKPYMAES